MKHIAHPIIGDAKHGKGTHNRFFQSHFNCHRLLLHCSRMQLAHPASNTTLTIDAPMDESFVNVLDQLGWQIPNPGIHTDTPTPVPVPVPKGE